MTRVDDRSFSFDVNCQIFIFLVSFSIVLRTLVMSFTVCCCLIVDWLMFRAAVRVCIPVVNNDFLVVFIRVFWSFQITNCKVRIRNFVTRTNVSCSDGSRERALFREDWSSEVTCSCMMHESAKGGIFLSIDRELEFSDSKLLGTRSEASEKSSCPSSLFILDFTDDVTEAGG